MLRSPWMGFWILCDLGIKKYIFCELGFSISTMLGMNIQISREVGLKK